MPDRVQSCAAQQSGEEKRVVGKRLPGPDGIGRILTSSDRISQLTGAVPSIAGVFSDLVRYLSWVPIWVPPELTPHYRRL
jgi:hypothetical protein